MKPGGADSSGESPGKALSMTLDAVRRIRNPIMHFRTDLLTSEQKDRLASLLRSMRGLDRGP